MAAAGKKHRLLLYTRLFGVLRVPSLLIAVSCGLLWWFAPAPFDSDLAQAGLLVVAVICGLLFSYALVGPALSYVQCLPKYVCVRTPLYRLVISYSRIRTVRPILFSPAGLRWSQRSFVEPFVGRTFVALDLSRYPLSERWLRLWLNEFMFDKDFTGLLFVTEDWMALSRDIDVHRSEWKTRHVQERLRATSSAYR